MQSEVRVREGQVESPRARGSRADGKGWDRLNLLSPGKLELPAGGLGVGRAGVSLAVQTPFMAETAELGRPGEPCTFLVLCPQNSLSSSSSQQGSPPETVTEMWDFLVSSKQSVRRNQS